MKRIVGGAFAVFTVAAIACGSSSSSPSGPSSSSSSSGSSGTDSGSANDSGSITDGSSIDASNDATTTCTTGTCTIAFASDTTWDSFDGMVSGTTTTAEGKAKTVCYNDTSPPNCPTDAVKYGFAGAAAQEDLSSIPGALWVWRGDVTTSGSANLVIAIFKKTFTLGANPSGSIKIAVDDYADVRVNGVSVGTIGSVSDETAAGDANGSLHTFDLSPQLKQGDNEIVIVAQNGPGSFASNCDPCAYTQNPATLVFGGTLEYH